MAGKTLSLELDGEVSLDELAAALSALQKIGDAVGNRVAPGVRIRWVISDLEAGSTLVGATAVLEDDQQDETILSDIIEELERSALAAESHAPVEPALQSQFDQLTAMINGHITAVRIGGNERYELRRVDPGDVPRMVVLGERVADLGEVTGRVETMNGHRSNWFNVYELVHGKRVRCNVPTHLVPIMEAAWLKLVTVHGTVTRDGSGHPVSVSDVSEITIQERPHTGAWRRAMAAGTRDDNA